MEEAFPTETPTRSVEIDSTYVVIPGMGEANQGRRGQTTIDQLDEDRVRIWFANSYKVFEREALTEAIAEPTGMLLRGFVLCMWLGMGTLALTLLVWGAWGDKGGWPQVVVVAYWVGVGLIWIAVPLSLVWNVREKTWRRWR